ncbi:MAG: redox-sensing transcriptional repressor Rex [Ruminococcus sp.]|nr:redox-sensing transcriptional repressor Rex [Ruminococcus sp.]
MVSKPTLRRLPMYLTYLKTQAEAGKTNISATAVANALGLNEVQVRKDLSAASKSGGKPKIGYCIAKLTADLEEFLGYQNTKSAILVGVGRLGGALLSFRGFQDCGMRIAAAFDNDPQKIGTEIDGIRVYNIEDLPHICKLINVHIGIITTKPEEAQAVCDTMLRGGIRAIWNFSTAHLDTSPDVIVHHENLAVSLAMISHDLERVLRQEQRRNAGEEQ